MQRGRARESTGQNEVRWILVPHRAAGGAHSGARSNPPEAESDVVPCTLALFDVQLTAQERVLNGLHAAMTLDSELTSADQLVRIGVGQGPELTLVR